MNISKISSENVVPTWAAKDNYDVLAGIDHSRLNRIASLHGELNDNDIVEEFELVEKCASSKTPYHYNLAWSQNSISQIKEYANISGLNMDNFVGVKTPKEIVKANSNGLIRTASTNEQSISEKLKQNWSDPFRFDKHADTSHMEKKNWEQVTRQNNMKEAPIMDGKSLIPVRGGERYDSNSTPSLAPGNNSIYAPNAIGAFADNKVEDTGVRLAREKKEKEIAKVETHKNWEKEKISAMDHNDIVSKGKVFPTELLVTQSGLNSPSSQMGVYSKFDKNAIPEKTAGELIKSQNDSRRKSISRDEKSNDWQKPSQQTLASVSDSFAESLKKSLRG